MPAQGSTPHSIRDIVTLQLRCRSVRPILRCELPLALRTAGYRPSRAGPAKLALICFPPLPCPRNTAAVRRRRTGRHAGIATMFFFPPHRQCGCCQRTLTPSPFVLGVLAGSMFRGYLLQKALWAQTTYHSIMARSFQVGFCPSSLSPADKKEKKTTKPPHEEHSVQRQSGMVTWLGLVELGLLPSSLPSPHRMRPVRNFFCIEPSPHLPAKLSIAIAALAVKKLDRAVGIRPPPPMHRIGRKERGTRG